MQLSVRVATGSDFVQSTAQDGASPGLSFSTEAMSPAERYSAKFFSGVIFSLMNSPISLPVLRAGSYRSLQGLPFDGDKIGNQQAGGDAVGDPWPESPLTKNRCSLSGLLPMKPTLSTGSST